MTSEDDFELMEIPLSPTNYEQPSTPEHPPPSALEAEKAIMEVLDNLRNVSISVSNLFQLFEIGVPYQCNRVAALTIPILLQLKFK